MKVSEAIARILKAEGVEFLVCYPRQVLIDPCSEVGIRPIICRQERVGANIADGISRSTNGARIGVFSMQGGPGVENAFPGVAQAFGDNVPLLLLPGGEAVGRSHTPPIFNAVEPAAVPGQKSTAVLHARAAFECRLAQVAHLPGDVTGRGEGQRAGEGRLRNQDRKSVV